MGKNKVEWCVDSNIHLSQSKQWWTITISHTQVTIGKGHLDHIAIMDWYVDEVKELAAGDDYFFGAARSFKRVKMGIIAYLFDWC